MFCFVREIDLKRCSYTLADVRTQESIWPYRKYVSIVGIGKTIAPRLAYLRLIGTRSFPSEQLVNRGSLKRHRPTRREMGPQNLFS